MVDDLLKTLSIWCRLLSWIKFRRLMPTT